MADKIKILLADNEQVFCEGLARLLQDNDQIEVIQEYEIIVTNGIKIFVNSADSVLLTDYSIYR